MPNELKKWRRRPLLSPLLFPLGAMVALVAIAVWLFDARTTTVIIAVNGAEMELPAGASGDANLSVSGKERAARLARMLAQAHAVDAVFAMETRRAQQTVLPLAEALGLSVNVIAQGAWGDFSKRIRREFSGRTVVVAGGSETLPALVAAVSDDAVTVADTAYDRLYVIFAPRLSRPRVVQLNY